MNRLSLILLTFIYTPHFAVAQTALPPTVMRTLNEAKIPPDNVSLYAREVGASTPLLDHRSSVAMHPASTIKLLTTLAALDTLGPNYTWRTDFLSMAKPVNGVLQGSIYIKGRGDPKFTWEHLQAALQDLRRQGIRKIAGDLVLDRSYFAPIAHDPALFDGEPLRPYNVGPDALLFNFKSIGFRFTPLVNGQVTVNTDMPQPDGLSIVNTLRTHKGSCGDWRTQIKPTFENINTTASARFSGSYSNECGERTWHVSLFDHHENRLLSGVFARLWRDMGGVWSGKMRNGNTPNNARLLYRHESVPLAMIVTDINKFSNNVMARQLLLTMDAERSKRPARAARGARLIKDWLIQHDIQAPELIIENGSGLSRKERITASNLARLLEYGLSRPYASDFLSSLPLAAIDGTLQKYFLNQRAEGNAFLKTGTLTGVKALAGYLLLPDERRMLFVAIVNHANAEGAQVVLDAAVDWSFSQSAQIANDTLRSANATKTPMPPPASQSNATSP